jgi:hypothetical protein
MCPGPGTCPGPPGNIGKHDVRASTDTHITSSAIIIHIFFIVHLLSVLIFEIFPTSALMLTEDSGVYVSCNRQKCSNRFPAISPFCFLLPEVRCHR